MAALSHALLFVLLTGMASGKQVTVTYADEPIWTVGIGVAFADMNIKLGETLTFLSYSDHDVVLVHAHDSGNHWNQCGPTGIAAENFTSIFTPSDFSHDSIIRKHYTPPTCGDFYIACSVSAHCAYGQRFKVTVKGTDGSSCSSPCLKAACVTTASKTLGAVEHVMKPMPNSGFWGVGPFSMLTVNTGDTVLFRTGAGFHDVATVLSATDFDSCNMKSKVVVADWPYQKTLPTAACNTSTDCCPSGSCGAFGYYVTYTFTAKVAGDTYFVCSYGGGGHCKQGQKFRVKVVDAKAAANIARHSAEPFLASVFIFMVYFWPLAFELVSRAFNVAV